MAIYRNTILIFIFQLYVALNNNDINGGMTLTEAAGHLSIHQFIKARLSEKKKKVHFTSVLHVALT